MWRLSLTHGVPFLLSAEYSVVMSGAWPGTLVILPWFHLSMMYCCALRLWSQICITCRSCWFPDSVALSCCAGASCPRDGYRAFHQPKFERGSCEMLVFRICGVRQNLHVFRLYRNPDLDDRILLLLLLLLKKVGSARLRERYEHPISPKTPVPQYQPTDRKKRNEKE